MAPSIYRAYAARLTAAGVETSAIRLPGMDHGFLALTTWVKGADTAVTPAVNWLEALRPLTA